MNETATTEIYTYVHTHSLHYALPIWLGDEPAAFALEGSIAVTCALIQWLRDNLGIIDTAAEVESLAESVGDSGGAVVVPAFSGLFAPHWRPDARGIIAGLPGYVTKAHLALAALEAVACQRSAERRGGKECVSTCRSLGSPDI